MNEIRQLPKKEITCTVVAQFVLLLLSVLTNKHFSI
jgi:hypothetical protein